MIPTTQDTQQTEHQPPTAKSRIGPIVATSLAAGLTAATVLVVVPVGPADEYVMTGLVLLGFALGWALLAVLSVRFSDQSQRWAAAPAAFMAGRQGLSDARQLVDVGGLYLHCTGSGSPTVAMEPGQGGVSSDFGWIAPAVARDRTVCVYDRPGRGWSDATDVPQDGDRIAADLHTLLDRAHVLGPYVLAGHSFGGLYVLRFAAMFPDQVAGLVLLDSTAPQSGSAVPIGSGPDSVLRRVTVLFSAVAHFGVARLIAQSSYGSLPPHSRDEARAKSSVVSHSRTFRTRRSTTSGFSRLECASRTHWSTTTHVESARAEPGLGPGLPEGGPGLLLRYRARDRDRPVTAEAIITRTAATAMAMSHRTQSIPGLPFPPNAV